MSEQDKEIFERIKELVKEDWFNKGEDAPDNIREEFEEVESDNELLNELLVTVSKYITYKFSSRNPNIS